MTTSFSRLKSEYMYGSSWCDSMRVKGDVMTRITELGLIVQLFASGTDLSAAKKQDLNTKTLPLGDIDLQLPEAWVSCATANRQRYPGWKPYIQSRPAGYISHILNAGVGLC